MPVHVAKFHALAARTLALPKLCNLLHVAHTNCNAAIP